MKIIQTRFLKKIVTCVMFVLISMNVVAQPHSTKLKRADSLFQARQYTQSYELYASLLKEKQYSSAMLLKMAYSQEGLGHTSMSLYYLKLYYMVSHDEQALGKMEEIAAKNRLDGYQLTDFNKLVTLLQQYSFQITSVLLSVVLFLFTLIIYQNVKQQKKPLMAAIALVFFLALLFANNHYGDYVKVGIVTQSSTYLMSGPSAGASVVGIINEGHQLKILGQTDVWIKVNWRDEEVYIKESSLLPINL
ncbi:MAG: SH3 domain-containing protein [Bacteroidia bacterium]|nr:SH3 domain-containing protein [Bacteroidia bacterium]